MNEEPIDFDEIHFPDVINALIPHSDDTLLVLLANGEVWAVDHNLKAHQVANFIDFDMASIPETQADEPILVK